MDYIKNNTDGILLINKDKDCTSFNVVSRLKKKLNIKKIGHSGTLDSNATGLLLVGIGKSTKLLKYFFGLSKRYLAEIYFGEQKNTDDILGTTINKTDNKIDFEIIKEQLKNFKGIIKQTPPDFSSIHVNGIRAYKLALKNQKPDIKERIIEIYNYNILDFIMPILKLEIDCSSGTYIRSIARDLGIKTGYYAYLYSLIRLKIQNFSINDSWTLNDIDNNNFKIITPFDALNNFTALEINEEYIKKIKNGCSIEPKWFNDNIDFNNFKNGYYKVHNNKNLLAIMKFNDGNFYYDLVY